MNDIPFCVRENGVLRQVSGRDWAQAKADVPKVGHGYTCATRTFYTTGPFIRTLS
jgi:hypothetical protein